VRFDLRYKKYTPSLDEGPSADDKQPYGSVFLSVVKLYNSAVVLDEMHFCTFVLLNYSSDTIFFICDIFVFLLWSNPFQLI
jgi:hypothetical protein